MIPYDACPLRSPNAEPRSREAIFAAARAETRAAIDPEELNRRVWGSGR